MPHTLVQTCVDWARCGLARPIAEPDLVALGRAFLMARRPDLILSEQAWNDALSEASRPGAGGDQAALLRAHRLPGLVPAV